VFLFKGKPVQISFKFIFFIQGIRDAAQWILKNSDILEDVASRIIDNTASIKDKINHLNAVVDSLSIEEQIITFQSIADLTITLYKSNQIQTRIKAIVNAPNRLINEFNIDDCKVKTIS